MNAEMYGWLWATLSFTAFALPAGLLINWVWRHRETKEDAETREEHPGAQEQLGDMPRDPIAKAMWVKRACGQSYREGYEEGLIKGEPTRLSPEASREIHEFLGNMGWVMPLSHAPILSADNSVSSALFFAWMDGRQAGKAERRRREPHQLALFGSNP